jgi:hypothetical protein
VVAVKGTYPVLFRSRIAGNIWWTYVAVQIRSNMTRRRDWKLKRADWRQVSFVREGIAVKMLNSSYHLSCVISREMARV